MAWFAVFESATGRLVSIASSSPSQLRAGLEVRTYESRPNLGANMWDEAARDFVPRPPPVFVDRVDDFFADSTLGPVVSRLSQEHRDRLRAVLGRMLGSRRLRKPNHPIDLK